MSNLLAYGIYRLGIAGYRINAVPSAINSVYKTSLIRYMMYRRGMEAVRRPVVGTINIKGLSRYVYR